MILSKILFFFSFFLSYWLRKWTMACKVLSGLLHGSLLMTFFYSSLLGIKISLMMWRLKNKLASLSHENKEENKLSWKELLGNVTAFVVFIFGCGFLVLYESVSGTSYFGFGANQLCVVTSDKGTLYLVIMPMLVSVILNVINTTYSGVVFYQLTASNVAVKGGTMKRLVTFLGRMMSFQSIQWSLGLIYFVTRNEIVGFIFEVFMSFEGFIMSGSFFFAEFVCK